MPRSTSTRCLPRIYDFATPFIETMLAMVILYGASLLRNATRAPISGNTPASRSLEADANLDRRLGAIGRRNDGDDAARQAPVRIRVQRDRGGLPCLRRG